MNNCMKKLFTVLLFMFFICSSAYAQYEGAEGYDENTEIRIKGAVTEVLPGMRGSVIVILKTSNREYRVVTGPQRYLYQEGFEFRTGDRVRVTGSKFIGRDGCLYVIARWISNVSTGRILLLRDSALIPLWRGPHHMGPPPSHMDPHNRDYHMMRDRD
jgi:hypothetical protein